MAPGLLGALGAPQLEPGALPRGLGVQVPGGVPAALLPRLLVGGW